MFTSIRINNTSLLDELIQEYSQEGDIPDIKEKILRTFSFKVASSLEQIFSKYGEDEKVLTKALSNLLLEVWTFSKKGALRYTQHPYSSIAKLMYKLALTLTKNVQSHDNKKWLERAVNTLMPGLNVQCDEIDLPSSKNWSKLSLEELILLPCFTNYIDNLEEITSPMDYAKSNYFQLQFQHLSMDELTYYLQSQPNTLFNNRFCNPQDFQQLFLLLTADESQHKCHVIHPDNKVSFSQAFYQKIISSQAVLNQFANHIKTPNDILAIYASLPKENMYQILGLLETQINKVLVKESDLTIFLSACPLELLHWLLETSTTEKKERILKLIIEDATISKEMLPYKSCQAELIQATTSKQILSRIMNLLDTDNCADYLEQLNKPIGDSVLPSMFAKLLSSRLHFLTSHVKSIMYVLQQVESKQKVQQLLKQINKSYHSIWLEIVKEVTDATISTEQKQASISHAKMFADLFKHDPYQFFEFCKELDAKSENLLRISAFYYDELSPKFLRQLINDSYLRTRYINDNHPKEKQLIYNSLVKAPSVLPDIKEHLIFLFKNQPADFFFEESFVIAVLKVSPDVFPYLGCSYTENQLFAKSTKQEVPEVEQYFSQTLKQALAPAIIINEATEEKEEAMMDAVDEATKDESGDSQNFSGWLKKKADQASQIEVPDAVSIGLDVFNNINGGDCCQNAGNVFDVLGEVANAFNL